MRSQFVCVTRRVVLWMKLRGMELVAAQFKHRVYALASRMVLRRIDVVAAHCVDGLRGISSTSFDLVNVALCPVHCHDGLCRMESARMTVFRLM